MAGKEGTEMSCAITHIPVALGSRAENGDHGNQGAPNALGKILAQNLDLTAVVVRANGGRV
jgi:hypothetical protein